MKKIIKLISGIIIFASVFIFLVFVVVKLMLITDLKIFPCKTAPTIPHVIEWKYVMCPFDPYGEMVGMQYEFTIVGTILKWTSILLVPLILSLSFIKVLFFRKK